MTVVIAADISEYQPPVDDSYPRQWLIFRACDGTYRDRNVAANLAWSMKAKAGGRLLGFTVYMVYRPGQNAALLATLDALGVPHDCWLMIDCESWGGQIVGDHSTELNQLEASLGARNGGRVWGYGNKADLAALWPTRTVPVIVASYGGTQPAVPNMTGWQYTDGQYTIPGLPSSSPPFGPCDHNQLTLTTEDDMLADERAALFRIDTRVAGLTTGGVAAGQATEGETIATTLTVEQGLVNSVAALKTELDKVQAAQATGGTPDYTALLQAASAHLGVVTSLVTK